MTRYFFYFAAALAALSQLSCRNSAPAGVAAMVNGHPITNAELDKVYQSQYPQPVEGATEDLLTTQRLDVLGNLITNEIMLQRAEKLGLTAIDADVDTQFNKMKAPYTEEEFNKQLAAQKLTREDLKANIRRQLTVDKLINKEITSLISITDADIANFYNANKASFNLAEPQVHLAQILVTPFADPEVRNLKNSKAQDETQAKTKILELETRLRAGEDFAMIAQNYSEDPKTISNGGDLGYVPESMLEKTSPEVRKIVMSLPAGSISQIVHTEEGYRIFKVFSREAPGQRELNDPRVQTNIRDMLRNSKDNLLRGAYYEAARNNAKVDNFLARKVIENASKK
jgi:peptidyl-prolyl cis-trans isomerase SurA